MTEQEEFEFRARAEAESQGAAPAPAAQQAPQELSFGDSLRRQGGLALRAAANVLASPLTLGGDLIGKVTNAAAGREVFQPSSETFNSGLTNIGLPEARTGIEKFTQDVAKTAPALAIPGGLQSQLAGNAAIGAIQAPQGKEALGAAMGATGALAGHVLPKVLSSGLPGVSKQARQLMDTSNVQPTVGMAIPKLRAAEEFTTGIPLLGEVTKTARQRAMNEFSDASIQQAVPKAKIEGNTAFEKLDAANDYVDSIYYDVLPKVLPEVTSGMGAAGNASRGASRQAFDAGYNRAQANSYLTSQQRDILDRVYQDRAANISSYTGEQLKRLDSELGEQIRKYQRGAGTADLADALREIQLGLREGIEMRLPATERGRLAEANKAYRELIALNDAASKSADFDITPKRLTKAIAARDKKPASKTSGPSANFARLGQDIVPETSGRGWSSPGLASAITGGVGATYFGHLPALMGTSALFGLGSLRPAQAALTGNLALQKALRARLGPSLPTRAMVGGQMAPEQSEE